MSERIATAVSTLGGQTFNTSSSISSGNAVYGVTYNNLKTYGNMAQPKYGVAISHQLQPKYGVIIHQGPVQPAYGVVVPHTPIGPVQPAYGVVWPGQDLNITYNQLEENIATLKKSISSLKQSWEVETKRNLNTLDNSWVGQDCASYTAKLNNMDKKVENTIAALELLCSTYEQARDMVKDSQSKTISSIESIN